MGEAITVKKIDEKGQLINNTLACLCVSRQAHAHMSSEKSRGGDSDILNC